MKRNFKAIGALVALAWGLFATPALAAAISIVWEPSPSGNVAGYAVYYGHKSGEHPTRIDVGKSTNLVFQAQSDLQYYFIVTAYTEAGLESPPSEEVAYVPGSKSLQLAEGTFIGLLDLESSQQSLGAFTLKKVRDSFSGTIRLHGKTYRFSGKANASGIVTVMIKRFGLTPLFLTFNADSNDKNQLNGSLTDGSWTMQLTADRATFHSKTNATCYAGNYTFAILGLLGQPLNVDGIGFGSVKVLSNGMVKAKGTLGDGNNFASSSYVSSNGVWPFYVPAYGRSGGAISGWMQFETNGLDSIHGDLSWIRPTFARSKFYPEGFTNSVAMIGSSYRSPTNASDPIIEVTNGTIGFSGGSLDSAFEKDVVVSSNQIFAATVSADALSVRIRKDNGSFAGTIQLPVNNSKTKFRGTLLQNRNAGYGLFMGTNTTGQVLLESAP